MIQEILFGLTSILLFNIKIKIESEGAEQLTSCSRNIRKEMTAKYKEK